MPKNGEYEQKPFTPPKCPYEIIIENGSLPKRRIKVTGEDLVYQSNGTRVIERYIGNFPLNSELGQPHQNGWTGDETRAIVLQFLGWTENGEAFVKDEKYIKERYELTNYLPMDEIRQLYRKDWKKALGPSTES